MIRCIAGVGRHHECIIEDPTETPSTLQNYHIKGFNGRAVNWAPIMLRDDILSDSHVKFFQPCTHWRELFIENNISKSYLFKVDSAKENFDMVTIKILH